MFGREIVTDPSAGIPLSQVVPEGLEIRLPGQHEDFVQAEWVVHLGNDVKRDVRVVFPKGAKSAQTAS